MGDYYYEPIYDIIEFIYKYVSDPNERTELHTQNISVSSDTMEVSFEPMSSSYITVAVFSVDVDTNGKVKYTDYMPVISKGLIRFKDMVSSGSNVSIYALEIPKTDIFITPPNPAIKDLTSLSYPRIKVSVISSDLNRIGNYQEKMYGSEVYQIDVFSKRGEVFTIDGAKISDGMTALYLMRAINKAFTENMSALHPRFNNYSLISFREPVLEVDGGIYHGIMEVKLDIYNPGFDINF